MELKVGATRIVLVQGDITQERVDAIVNAANSGLRGGGGVDGAIHRAGGPTVMEECRAIRERQGGCPTGEAVVTTAGRLAAKHVVHTVGPVWRDGQHREPELLRSAYGNALRVAAAQKAKTIAFPSISTGVYGYPIERAAPIALAAARDFALAHPAFTEIRFVLFSADDLQVYEAALRRLAKSER